MPAGQFPNLAQSFLQGRQAVRGLFGDRGGDSVEKQRLEQGQVDLARSKLKLKREQGAPDKTPEERRALGLQTANAIVGVIDKVLPFEGKPARFKNAMSNGLATLNHWASNGTISPGIANILPKSGEGVTADQLRDVKQKFSQQIAGLDPQEQKPAPVDADTRGILLALNRQSTRKNADALTEDDIRAGQRVQFRRQERLRRAGKPETTLNVGTGQQGIEKGTKKALEMDAQGLQDSIASFDSILETPDSMFGAGAVASSKVGELSDFLGVDPLGTVDFAAARAEYLSGIGEETIVMMNDTIGATMSPEEIKKFEKVLRDPDRVGPKVFKGTVRTIRRRAARKLKSNQKTRGQGLAVITQPGAAPQAPVAPQQTAAPVPGPRGGQVGVQQHLPAGTLQTGGGAGGAGGDKANAARTAFHRLTDPAGEGLTPKAALDRMEQGQIITRQQRVVIEENL